MKKLNMKLVIKIGLAIIIVTIVGILLQKEIHKASLDRTLNDFRGKIITLDTDVIACDSKRAMRTWHHYERQLNYSLMVSSTDGHCDAIGSAGYKLKVLSAELLDETHAVEDELLAEITGATSQLTSSGLYIRLNHNE